MVHVCRHYVLGLDGIPRAGAWQCCLLTFHYVRASTSIRSRARYYGVGLAELLASDVEPPQQRHLAFFCHTRPAEPHALESR
jgi:hypothetical protein